MSFKEGELQKGLKERRKGGRYKGVLRLKGKEESIGK